MERRKNPQHSHHPTHNPVSMTVADKIILLALIIFMLTLWTSGEAQTTPTPQEGYDGLNMSPQGLYWQNRGQAYGEPALDRYRPAQGLWRGFSPYRPRCEGSTLRIEGFRYVGPREYRIQ